MSKKDKKSKDSKKSGSKTLVMTDDCLTPGRSINLLYKGANPSGIASKLTGSFQTFFRVSSAGWGEPRFEWDKSGEPVSFFMKWWVKRSMSAASSMRLNITLQGDENSQTKMGKFTLEITPVIENKVPESWLARSIFWIYQYLFYNKVRQDYIKKCRQVSNAYREHLKNELGLVTSEGREHVLHKI